MWVIALDLNMAYYVFRSLIFFEKRPGRIYIVTCNDLTIQQRECLFRRADIQSLFPRQVINIVFNCNIVIYTCIGILTAIVHWPMMVMKILAYYILNCHVILLLSQILNPFICGNFEHKRFTGVDEIKYHWLSIITNRWRNKVTLNQIKRTMKYRALSGFGWSWWGISWLRNKLPGFR